MTRTPRDLRRANVRWVAKTRRAGLGTIPEIRIPDPFAIRAQYLADQRNQWIGEYWPVLAVAGVAGMAFLGWLVLPWVGSVTRHVDFTK